MESAQGVDERLTPIRRKVLATFDKRIVHCLIDTRLEQADEILDILPDVCEILRNGLADGGVAVFHVSHKDIEIVVPTPHHIGQRQTKHLVLIFCDESLKTFFLVYQATRL